MRKIDLLMSLQTWYLQLRKVVLTNLEELELSVNLLLPGKHHLLIQEPLTQEREIDKACHLSPTLTNLLRKLEGH